MIPTVRLPAPDRPGFCQTCYCEHCGRGFYEKARNAVKFSDGRIKCSAQGCEGRVLSEPVLGWQRQTPCKSCSYVAPKLATVVAEPPQATA